MAAFEFISFQIVMDETPLSRLESPSDHPMVSISLVHEYVHFLQSISSLMGFNLLEEIINFGTNSACRIAKVTRLDPGYSLFELLKGLPDRAGQGDDLIRPDADSLREEIHNLVSVADHPYDGEAQPWDIVRSRVTRGGKDEDLFGFVTEQGRFRPFSPAIAVEGMARQADRWFAGNMDYLGPMGHKWPENEVEKDVYLGLRNILLQPRYRLAVHEDSIDEYVVLLSTLTLLCRHPDWAMMEMLRLLEQAPDWIPLANRETELRAHLVRHDELHARFFNDTMQQILKGHAALAQKSEFMPIYDLLTKIHAASIRALGRSDFLVNRDLDWDRAVGLMRDFGIPPIEASDGRLFGFSDIPCNKEMFELINLIYWKILAPPLPTPPAQSV